MTQQVQLPRVFSICLYVASALGAVLILAGIYAIYSATATGSTLITIKGVGELNASEGIVMLILGGFLVALAWIPNVLHRPASLPVLTQTVQGEKYESSKAVAVVAGNQARSPVIQPPGPAWRIVSADEYRAIGDVSIWDIPLVSPGKALFGKPVPRVSENYIVHANDIAVTLTSETSVDNLLYSGELPNDPELRNRFLSIGIELGLIAPIRVQFSQNPECVDDVFAHFGIREPIPYRSDGKLDVDAAIGQMRTAILGEIEAGANSEITDDVMKALRSLQRTDLPITKNLRNSVAFLVFRGQSIIDSDPILRLTLGSGLSIWQFIQNIQRVIPGVNATTASNLKWSDDNKFASFTMETNINNARVGSKYTSVGIAKLFWVTQQDDLFHVIQANRVFCPLVAMDAIHEGLSDILQSSGVELSKGIGHSPKLSARRAD